MTAHLLLFFLDMTYLCFLNTFKNVKIHKNIYIFSNLKLSNLWWRDVRLLVVDADVASNPYIVAQIGAFLFQYFSLKI